MGDFKLFAEQIARAKHGRDFIVGVDLGQARDYTAIAVLERFEELTGEAAKGRWLTQVRYEMPHLLARPIPRSSRGFYSILHLPPMPRPPTEPSRHGRGEHEVIVVALAPGFIGVISARRGGADALVLYSEDIGTS